ncbi:serine/threonine-protein kinase [Planctomycetota bacterium]
MPQPLQLKSGQQVYKHKLRNRIGGGDFGDVWLSHDKSINRDVAVKILDASQVSVDERLLEAQIGNHLDHQNLVKVHYADVTQYNGKNIVIIAMDYHKNGSVLSKLNAGNFMSIPEALRYITDVLRGLEYLHENNFYHGDIKPQNILIGNSNEGVLTDYGITCQSSNLQPVKPRSAYKLHIAPEILSSNQIDTKTDIYQIGLTLFRLLNGIGTTRDKFNRLGESDYYQLVQNGKLIHSSDYQPFIPTNLKAVINKAINAIPSKRYQSSLEMRRALERLNYPGYWTCDACGNLQGKNDKYEFRYEEKPLGDNRFNFIAFKKSKSTGRETRISNYCCKKATNKQVSVMKMRFLRYVVIGK